MYIYSEDQLRPKHIFLSRSVLKTKTVNLIIRVCLGSVYQGEGLVGSRRGSVSSEPRRGSVSSEPSEVPSSYVKFVKDNYKFWYKVIFHSYFTKVGGYGEHQHV